VNEDQKQSYLEKYKKAKEKGVPFFPDILFKDALVSLIVFLILVALSYLFIAPLEERANPADASYNPRPEWYFLFLFQLLSYFPPSLEVVGVVVLPTLAIILLFLLPVLDKRPERYFRKRLWVIGVTAFLFAGVVFLTYQAVVKIPPPAEASAGDPTAKLYADNCAGCHGLTIAVPPGTNLHDIITRGQHEGMPAWSADLTTDEVDALAGFILSPAGSKIFSQNCGACHDASELVAGDPQELKNALAEGRSYPPHAELDIPEWAETLAREERTALVNFLIAPDGQRLFAINCSPCHGISIGFSGDEADLRDLITQGGAHLEMPPWQEKLSSAELNALANYVLSPADHPEAQELFNRNCSNCHGTRVPSSNSVDQARQIIATGGPHETMPVWGNVLTQEQIDALVQYTLAASKGTPLEVGQNLFTQNCSSCHGDFGEGGENPARPDDVIAPISTAEYLKTRDNFTLKQIISQGQPNFGMAPFGSAFGGPLEDDAIDAIVAYIRSWENDPPVELPPEVAVEGDITLAGDEIYDALCYQCHGADENGVRVAPSLGDPEFQASNTDQDIYDIISLGHRATSMIAWGEILTADQITQLVAFIRQLPPDETITAVVSFKNDVLPIFEDRCTACHDSPDTIGGWDGTTYEGVMNTGDHAPVVIPGDPDNSLLALKILGTQEVGKPMPPLGALSDRNIQVILDWIAAGAPNN